MMKAILAKNDYPSEIIKKETKKFIANNKVVKYLVLLHVNNRVIDYGKRLKNFVNPTSLILSSR